ncbi:MAG TPA: hypothetical protein VMI52_02820 [Acetobacteraceae bacterium]|nr:hypothetical protein [Acetobacteraceae bacterium]
MRRIVPTRSGDAIRPLTQTAWNGRAPALRLSPGWLRGMAAPPFRRALVQMLVVALVLLVSGAIGWFGAAGLARLLFMGGALAAGAWYERRSPWLYLTLTFWFWTLTPFIRRIIEYNSGFDPTDIVLVTPNLVAMFMLRDIVTSRTLLRRRETLTGLLLLAPAVYGLAVNFVEGDLYPGAVAAADWLVPLLYYFYIIDKASDVAGAEADFRWFVTLNALVVVGYGLWQFFHPPAWDVAWSIASSMEMAEARAEEIRVFGTLNSTGVLAEWLGALILLALYFRTRLTIVLLPATALVLLFSWVRSVTVGVVLSVMLAAWIGGGRMTASLLRVVIAAVVVGVIALSFNPIVADRLMGRIDSLGELQSDASAHERAALWRSGPRLIDAHPFGMGIGALGRGAVAANDPDLVSVDAGPVAIYLSLGWVAGTIYLVGMFAVVVQALLAARRTRSGAACAFAVAAFCTFFELAFVNIQGFAGCVLWLCGGFATAYGIAPREQALEMSPVLSPADFGTPD